LYSNILCTNYSGASYAPPGVKDLVVFEEPRSSPLSSLVTSRFSGFGFRKVLQNLEDEKGAFSRPSLLMTFNTPDGASNLISGETREESGGFFDLLHPERMTQREF
jgi:hypothetical protein